MTTQELEIRKIKYRQRTAAYRKKHPDKISEYYSRPETKIKAALRQQRYRKRHPEKVAAYAAKKETKYLRKHSYLKKNYGISGKEFKALFEQQGHKCAICLSSGSCEIADKNVLFVDHNHKTGEVRGLLCRECNSALGFFNEDIGRLRSAMAYLQKAYNVRLFP